jgi:hypothetical protein
MIPRRGDPTGESEVSASRMMLVVQYRLPPGMRVVRNAERGVAWGHPPPRAGMLPTTRPSHAPQATRPRNHAPRSTYWRTARKASSSRAAAGSRTAASSPSRIRMTTTTRARVIAVTTSTSSWATVARDAVSWELAPSSRAAAAFFSGGVSSASFRAGASRASGSSARARGIRHE